MFSDFSLGMKKPDAYNPYSAGPKKYGLTGTLTPNMGATGAQGMMGYAKRDAQQQARKQAYLQYMQAQQGGNFMSPSFLRGQ